MKSFKFFTSSLYVMAALLVLVFSCNDENGSGYSAHDPSQPVVLESFYPDSGGMATKVIMKGKNFGNNANEVKVYYNDKRAAVVSANGSQMYVITPKQPGDTCRISVVIGKDSSAYSATFRYRTMTTVTTVVGQKGTSEFKGGTLANATFHHPGFLCIDKEDNIFLSHWGTPYNFVIISQRSNEVRELMSGGGALNVPAVDNSGKLVVVPSDGGYNYYSFDADAQWAKKSLTIQRPTSEEIAAGKKDFTINWKHGFATNEIDGYVYTRSYHGQLLRFNPRTKAGELVVDELLMPDSDSYLQFHPVQKNILYMSYPAKHVIYTYNLDTKEHLRYAGTQNVSGWRDGDRLDSEFNTPRQVVFDEEGALVIADEYNHCIRKITPEGIVSTVIGMGGKSGYQDGNPDDALFNRPRGVAIDSEYNIYIADYDNNCIRKLAIE
ncbi:MAG: IPT/TIG domain-containing protein [Prevotellaceae bacterium]|nr:IPT/TIG domain-containing protein [Prevotellaceae bacterium]